jgi:hypothetical protein
MVRCRAECKECSQATLPWACRINPECKVLWVECREICKPCFNNSNKAVLVEMVMVDLPHLPVAVVVLALSLVLQVVPWEVREVPEAKAFIPVIERQRVSSRPPWRLATMRVVEVQEVDPTVLEVGIMVEAVAVVVSKHSLICTVLRHQVAARVLGSKCQAGHHRNYRI